MPPFTVKSPSTVTLPLNLPLPSTSNASLGLFLNTPTFFALESTKIASILSEPDLTCIAKSWLSCCNSITVFVVPWSTLNVAYFVAPTPTAKPVSPFTNNDPSVDCSIYWFVKLSLAFVLTKSVGAYELPPVSFRLFAVSAVPFHI